MVFARRALSCSIGKQSQTNRKHLVSELKHSLFFSQFARNPRTQLKIVFFYCFSRQIIQSTVKWLSVRRIIVLQLKGWRENTQGPSIFSIFCLCLILVSILFFSPATTYRFFYKFYHIIIAELIFRLAATARIHIMVYMNNEFINYAYKTYVFEEATNFNRRRRINHG